MIPYGRQSINHTDIESVTKALMGDLITTGPLVHEFEQALSAVVSAPTVVVSSGTAALHTAYAAIGIKPGDEVITPPITFIATQATAAIMGAKIVFADVSPDTFNIDPSQVEKKITKKTRAIVAVDFAGHPSDLNELREISRAYNVYLIEDASHSLGSTYRGTPVGSIADITTFSFFPTKSLTTAEGGAVSTKDSLLLERARLFSRQGLIRDPAKFKLSNEGIWHQEVHEFGLNYRLSDVMSALGLSQLERLDSFKNKKRKIYDLYKKELSDLTNLRLPIERDYVWSNWHLFPVLVDAHQRKSVFEKLRQAKIGVQVNYLPAYRHPVFLKNQINKDLFPVSENFYSREISLPLYPDLSTAECDYIISTLKSILGKLNRI